MFTVRIFKGSYCKFKPNNSITDSNLLLLSQCDWHTMTRAIKVLLTTTYFTFIQILYTLFERKEKEKKHNEISKADCRCVFLVQVWLFLLSVHFFALFFRTPNQSCGWLIQALLVESSCEQGVLLSHTHQLSVHRGTWPCWCFINKHLEIKWFKLHLLIQVFVMCSTGVLINKTTVAMTL